MEQNEMRLDDWHRIFIGNAPVQFLVEVLVRSIFLYVFLLIVLRLMGKRMGGMLTISELAVMLTLGAIICVPMQIPDRGIFHGLIVLTCAFVFQRLFTLIGQYTRLGERITQGKEIILLMDGIINSKALDETDISRQQLYAVLRSQGIYNLGAVERIYLEASGIFSVYLFPVPRLGLPLYPSDNEPTPPETNQQVRTVACRHCGFTKNDDFVSGCTRCNEDMWTTAIA